ncbi:MAG: hypothetical protein CVV14_06480 [Gammaproteobacteria bacterium HGW-Gammaproteobacteria-4]|jgi:phosphatidylglycerophosphate synthase|nr:MAG: hypothetical protein CVV14_06480 [Gammaproteobacteria bacterium HGW-Gammaproteobacteria-4]
MPTPSRKAEHSDFSLSVAANDASRRNDAAVTCVYAIAHTPVRLWGIDAQTRLRRQVAQLPNLRWIDDLSEAGDTPVVIVRADYLFEVRTLKALALQSDVVLYCGADERAAAVQLTHADRAQAQRWLADRDGEPPVALRKITADALSRFDATLRRAETPLLEPVSAERRGELESMLYGNAYKGITDLVTKWLWPAPARRGVRWCADNGITPNAVTSFGLLLVLGAGFAFWQGHYALGLAMGWVMTWLDTVDGKLARVTVQSSRIGHLMDHGVDLIHPPFWYVLWGVSLVGFQPVFGLDLAAINGLIIGGYVGGRVIEGVFDRLLGCSVFAWRPFDAWFRLITARRNPALILLSAGVIAGRPDLGLVAVALWTAVSTAVLIVRMMQGIAQRVRCGALESWLADGNQAQQQYPRSFRTFANTRAAYAGAAPEAAQSSVRSANAIALHAWLEQHSDGAEFAADPTVAALLDVLRKRFGDSLSAVLIYGSYLRGKRDTVLDFYVLLEDYRALPWWQTMLCCIVSPNVYQIKVDSGGKEIRAKCAALSLGCFERAVRRDFHSYFWARFAQPSKIVYCNDQTTRNRVVTALANAARTFIGRALPVLPPSLSTHDLWAGALLHTYRSELRVEKPGRIEALVDAEPEYYRTVTPLLDIPALQPAASGEPEQWCADVSAGARRRGALEWRLRRIVGKVLTVFRVATAATMFDAPLDYILWKIERHTGMRAKPNALQRRWPLVFAWPLLWGLYRRGAFR